MKQILIETMQAIIMSALIGAPFVIWFYYYL